MTPSQLRNSLALQLAAAKEAKADTTYVDAQIASIITGDPAFVMRVRTDYLGESSTNQFILPVPTSGSYTYDYTVDWGDGTSDHYTAAGNRIHTFPSVGVYDIRITGQFPHLQFAGGGDRRKLLAILNWGRIAWRSFLRAFQGCSNLQILAQDHTTADLSAAGISFYAAFQDCTSLHWMPPLDLSNGNNFAFTWSNTALDAFPVVSMTKAIDFYHAWYGCTLSTRDWSAILINLASNRHSWPSYGATLTGGNSKYNAAGAAARAILTGQGVTVQDGGPA